MAKILDLRFFDGTFKDYGQHSLSGSPTNAYINGSDKLGVECNGTDTLVTYTDSPYFWFINENSPLTVMANFRASATSVGCVIFEKRNIVTGANLSLQITSLNNLRAVFSDGANTLVATDTAPLVDGKEYTIFWSYDGNNNLRLYVDGVQVAEDSVPVLAGVNLIGGHLTVGGSVNPPIKGLVHSVMMWDEQIPFNIISGYDYYFKKYKSSKASTQTLTHHNKLYPSPGGGSYVGSWQFENLGGKVTDLITPYYDGKIADSHTTAMPIGEGQEFDSSFPEPINFGDETDFNIEADENFTIEVFGTINDFTNIQRFLGRDDGPLGPGNMRYMTLMASAGYPSIYVIDSALNFAYTTSSKLYTAPHTCYHIVGVFDRSRQYCQLYVNGINTQYGEYGDISTIGALNLVGFDLLFGNETSGSYPLNAKIGFCNFSKEAWGEDLIKSRAKKLLEPLGYKCNFRNAVVMPSTVGAGSTLEGTDYKVVSGTWSVNDTADVPGNKQLYCDSTGWLHRKIKNNQAFGFFSGSIRKENSADEMYVYLCSDTDPSLGGHNGYAVHYDINDFMHLLRFDSGVPTTIVDGTGTVFAPGSHYSYGVIRNPWGVGEMVAQTVVLGSYNDQTYRESYYTGTIYGTAGCSFTNINESQHSVV